MSVYRKIRILPIIVLLLITNILSGQNIEGDWYGTLNAGNQSLRLRFSVQVDTSCIYNATLDIFDQSAFGIPADSVFFENNIFRIVISGIEYRGILVRDSIKGVFKQNNHSFPLDLTNVNPGWLKRSQEPKEPFGYRSENIKFSNSKDNITLAGTLTLPPGEGTYPAVILISGSGPQNRDEEIMHHKPFLVLSDYLTKLGIAVLRFDDRGIGDSEGDFNKATTMDFVSDVEAAFDYLSNRKDIKMDKIGLAGHSEGGIVASLVANSRNKCSFIVLLASPSIKGSDLILAQQEMIARASGVPEGDILDYRKLNESIMEVIDREKDASLLEKVISEMIISASSGVVDETTALLHAKKFTTPWMLFYLRYDPSIALREVKVPILAIYGKKDLQVPSGLNKEAFNKNVILNNKEVLLVEFENINHLMQNAVTGHPNEYSTIKETISTEVLKTIGEWITKQVE